MREHPVPQDVTGYQFHIIGEMTIKQFALVGGGVFLAFLMYTTNLPQVIKWPIMAVLAGLGAAAAFVPIEEQPIDHWIVTFFKVLYKPTKYYWHRQKQIPEVFTHNKNAPAPAPINAPAIAPEKRQQVREYLFSLDNQVQDEFEVYEQQRVQQIQQSFNQVNPTSRAVTPTQHRSFNKQTIITPAQKKVVYDSASPADQSWLLEDSSQISPPLTQHTPPGYVETPQKSTQKVVAIPDYEELSLNKRQAPVVVQVDATGQPINTDTSQLQYAQATQQTPAAPATTQAAQYNQSLPFPISPTVPNKVVGMVLSKTGELINDAIVEISKKSGEVVRAVKTNSLGQFFVSTPLKKGEYLLSAEKDGFEFVPQNLILEDKILSPIEVRSK